MPVIERRGCGVVAPDDRRIGIRCQQFRRGPAPSGFVAHRAGTSPSAFGDRCFVQLVVMSAIPGGTSPACGTAGAAQRCHGRADMLRASPWGSRIHNPFLSRSARQRALSGDGIRGRATRYGCGRTVRLTEFGIDILAQRESDDVRRTIASVGMSRPIGGVIGRPAQSLVGKIWMRRNFHSVNGSKLDQWWLNPRVLLVRRFIGLHHHNRVIPWASTDFDYAIECNTPTGVCACICTCNEVGRCELQHEHASL